MAQHGYTLARSDAAGRWEQAAGEEPPGPCSRRQGGPHAQKVRSPCAVPSGVLRWPVSLAGESAHSEPRAGPCWAEQCSPPPDHAPEAAGQGTATAGPAGHNRSLSLSAFPRDGLGQPRGLLPPGLTHCLPPRSMASCWTPGPPTRPCSSTSGLQTRRTTPGWSASTACAMWRVRAVPVPRGQWLVAGSVSSPAGRAPR